MTPPLALPHRPEAELAVLGAILLRGREALADVTDLLGENDFYQQRAITVFKAMLALEHADSPIDFITVEAQLCKTSDRDGDYWMEWLAQLDRHVTCHNIRAHAELIHEAALVRNMVVASREIAEDGMLDVGDVDEYLAAAERKVLVVRGVAEKPGPEPEPEPVVEGRPVPLGSPKGQERLDTILARAQYCTHRCHGAKAEAEASALRWVVERLEMVERELAEMRRGWVSVTRADRAEVRRG